MIEVAKEIFEKTLDEVSLERKELQIRRAELLEQLRPIEREIEEIEGLRILADIVGKYFVRIVANEREYFYVMGMTGSGTSSRLQTIGFTCHASDYGMQISFTLFLDRQPFQIGLSIRDTEEITAADFKSEFENTSARMIGKIPAESRQVVEILKLF